MLCRKTLLLRVFHHWIDTFVITVYLCVSLKHTKETLTCPLGIVVLVRVETVSGTLSKVFVYRITDDSLDRLSDTSHFCWSLRLAEASTYPNNKKAQGQFLCIVGAVKSSCLDSVSGSVSFGSRGLHSH